MERMIGTVSRGVRAPIIREGDDLAQIVVDSVLAAAESAPFTIEDRDVIAVTEAVVARAQGNYASVQNIAADVKNKLGGGTVGVIFPILSRNRFAICLKGIAMGCKKVVLMLSYPSDEVGNHLIDLDEMDEKGVNPWTDVLTEEKYRELFGYKTHVFTGVDYVDYYKKLIESTGAEAEVIFANDPRAILEYSKNVLACDIHTRARTKRLLKKAGAEVVCTLDDIMTASIDGSGYNDRFGLLGSNKATEESVKLFPIHCDEMVSKIHQMMALKTGKNVEVMIYGDGAFKDPVGKIWELADNDFADLKGDELKEAIKGYIHEKDEKAQSLKGTMVTQGTTPRRLTDLIGSLADLTSGSGDKGTPIIYIQGYFDNYTK